MAEQGVSADPRLAAALRAGDRAENQGLRDLGILLLLLGVTFGQRFAFTFGASQIPIALPIAYVALALFLVSGLVRIGTTALLLYAVTVAAMIATFFSPKAWFSLSSFGYLVVLYFVYVFNVETSREDYLRHLRTYQNIMVVMAAIAILQFGEQLTTGSILSLFDYVPKGFWIEGYNTRPTLGYGSTFHKSNADFFLEPSFLSQYLAVAVIIEILYFGRVKRMALYGFAIFTSFSGTGMVLLGLFALVSIIKARRFELLWPLPLLAFVFFLIQDNPYIAAITGRVDEFGTQGSSAFIRFNAPTAVLFDIIGNDFGAFLIGKGPGLVDQLGELYRFGESNYPALHKLLIEYGIVGTLPFMAFILHCFFGRVRSRVLSSALFLMYIVLSGSLLQPHTIYLFYVLAIAMPAREGEEAPSRPEAPAAPAFA